VNTDTNLVHMRRVGNITPSRSLRSILPVVALLVASLVQVGVASATLPVPTNCQDDVNGPNDEPGQKDVTRFCVDDGDGSPFELYTLANWDETKLTGSNTADVCILFDNDGDGLVNLAVCVTLQSSGHPNANLAIFKERRLFTCGDTKSDRCTGPTQLMASFVTACESSQRDTDPFGPSVVGGPGDSYPDDTEILCAIDLADFGAFSGGAKLLDACSYPSTIPNSDPSDCVLFSTCSSAADCDDGNPCTIDSCNASAGTCAHVADPGAACDNGFFCDGDETCNSLGFCQTTSARDCDDDVSCTIDDCDELIDECTHDPRNSLCSDGQFCNGVETCDAVNGCQAGTPPKCSDCVQCTVDTCNETMDRCDHLPSNAACNDGKFCNGVETCDLVNGCQAGAPPDCNDGVGCTVDSCNESTDTCDHTPNDTACSDCKFCNGVETCDVANDCQPGTPPDCSDDVGCTIDSCNEAADRCDHLPSNGACNDGRFCNGVEICDVIDDCQPGTPPDCDDGVGCTVDSCNEANDTCDHTANDAACSDGQFCNGAETCDLLQGCRPGMSPDCSDDVGCTVDSCNESTDTCDHTANDAACSDCKFCNGPEVCDVVEDCQPGVPPNCDDSVACTVDSCNERTDTCDHLPNNDACSDGTFCTGVEVCDPSAGCGAGTNPCPGLFCNEGLGRCVQCVTNADCDNSVFCDGAETCNPSTGECQAGAPPDCDDGVGCTVDSCNEGTATCDHTGSDAACSDDLFCNGIETCDAIDDCQSGTPPNCDDAVSCTNDSCNETTDLCDHTPDDATCSDGQFCNGVETCDVRYDCQAGTPPTCNDGVACTIDSCNEGTDSCGHQPDDTYCNDGRFCNGQETCDASADCQSGTPPACDDGVACTVDSCDQGTDTCTHMPNDAACDDEVFCNGVETCDSFDDCQAGTPPDCTDGIGCTIDRCDSGLDTCVHSPDDSSCDDGLFCNGVERCDLVDDCAPGTAVQCPPDGFNCSTDTCDEDTDRCVYDFSPCVCGDGEVTGQEQCDPPEPAGSFEDCNNETDDDGDGRADCRDPDCAPKARGPLCDEECTLDAVCKKFIRDPGRIRYYFDGRPDSLWLHGRFPLESALNPIADGIAIEFSNELGTFYRSILGWGVFNGRLGGRRFSFRDKSAKELGNLSPSGGLYHVSLIRRSFKGIPFLCFRVRIYGDFSKATRPVMTSQISVGTETGSLTAEWTARPRAWTLVQKDF